MNAKGVIKIFSGKSHRRSGNVRGIPESGEQSQYPWNPYFCTNEHHPVTHAGEEQTDLFLPFIQYF